MITDAEICQLCVVIEHMLEQAPCQKWLVSGPWRPQLEQPEKTSGCSPKEKPLILKWTLEVPDPRKSTVLNQPLTYNCPEGESWTASSKRGSRQRITGVLAWESRIVLCCRSRKGGSTLISSSKTTQENPTKGYWWRKPFFRVVAEDGPTLYEPCLLQQPPKARSTWFDNLVCRSRTGGSILMC